MLALLRAGRTAAACYLGFAVTLPHAIHARTSPSARFGLPCRWCASVIVPVTQICRRSSSGTPWTGWPLPPLLRRHRGRLLTATSTCCRVSLWWSIGCDLNPPQWIRRRWCALGSSRTRFNSSNSGSAILDKGRG
ncbi:hypothetical protein VPH35_006706 [Triticum aestivum]